MMVKGGFTMAKNKQEKPYGVTSGGENWRTHWVIWDQILYGLFALPG